MNPSSPNTTPIVDYHVFAIRFMRLSAGTGFQSAWGVDFIHRDGGETQCNHRHKSRNAAESCGKKAVRLAQQS